MPSGAQAGDIVTVGGYKENTAAVTPPDGTWTQKAALTTSATARGALHVFWKRLTAADTGTYTFTWTGSVFRAAAAECTSGRIATGDPFDGTVGTAESTSAVNILNVSTSPATALGDAVGFWTNFNGGTTFSAPTNYTQRQSVSSVICLETRDAVASGSTGNVTAGSTISDFEKAFLGVLAPAASGNSAPAGPALETDAAQALARTVSRAAGPSLETDVAQALSPVRTVAISPALETDAAQLVARTRTVSTSPATELDAAQALTRTVARPAGPAAETDVAQPLGTPNGTPITPAAETDVAQPLGRASSRTAGPALETDAALSVARSRLVVLGTAAETDTAQTVVRARTTPLSPALETDIALDVTNPNETIWELHLEAYAEPARWRVATEPDRWTGDTEPNPYRIGVEA